MQLCNEYGFTLHDSNHVQPQNGSSCCSHVVSQFSSNYRQPVSRFCSCQLSKISNGSACYLYGRIASSSSSSSPPSSISPSHTSIIIIIAQSTTSTFISLSEQIEGRNSLLPCDIKCGMRCTPRTCPHHHDHHRKLLRLCLESDRPDGQTVHPRASSSVRVQSDSSQWCRRWYMKSRQEGKTENSGTRRSDMLRGWDDFRDTHRIAQTS